VVSSVIKCWIFSHLHAMHGVFTLPQKITSTPRQIWRYLHIIYLPCTGGMNEEAVAANAVTSATPHVYFSSLVPKHSHRIVDHTRQIYLPCALLLSRPSWPLDPCFDKIGRPSLLLFVAVGESVYVIRKSTSLQLPTTNKLNILSSQAGRMINSLNIIG
jgi:hypothetical protein